MREYMVINAGPDTGHYFRMGTLVLQDRRVEHSPVYKPKFINDGPMYQFVDIKDLREITHD